MDGVLIRSAGPFVLRIPAAAQSHGGQQGDNMGPVGFFFATQVLWESFSDLAGVLWQAWYMDDGTIVGNMAALSQVVTTIQTQGPERGLSLNKSKCVLWGPGTAAENLSRHPALQGISLVPFLPGSGLRVLGVPVEHPAEVGWFCCWCPLATHTVSGPVAPSICTWRRAAAGTDWPGARAVSLRTPPLPSLHG